MPGNHSLDHPLFFIVLVFLCFFFFGTAPHLRIMPASDPSNLRLHVALLSGLTASIEAQGHWSVKTLRQHAQDADST